MPVALVRGLVGETADDGEVFFDCFKRAQDGRKLKGFSASAGSPFIGADTIGHEEAGHADGVGSGSFLTVKRSHRFEKREGESGAETAKSLAAGKLPAVGLNIGHRLGW